MSMEVQQIRRFNSMERRPRMLKDFLTDNNHLNSCSSSGFISLPRRIQPPPNGVVSSKSTTTFQTLMNTITTSFSFFTPSPSSSVLSLPRSLSRKLSRTRRRRSQARTVKIKDIIRWKSFRDLGEEEEEVPPPPPPSSLDFQRCTTESTTTVTTTTTTTCSSSSCGSSWSDGDFLTSLWEAQNDDVGGGKNYWFSPQVVGKGLVQPYAAVVGAKEVLACQEDEQHSPVSVLQVGADEFSSFDQSLANIQRRKQKFIQTVERFESLAKIDPCLLLDENSGYDEEHVDDDNDDCEDQKIEEQDWVEERAQQLLLCARATSSPVQSCKDYLDRVLLDFFRDELAGSRNQNRNDEEFEWEMLRIAEDWMNGSFSDDIIGLVNKDAYIKDMDRRSRWSKFEEEQEELALQIEAAIWNNLVADLLDLDG